MKAKALIKMLNSGDSGELRKGLGILTDKLATLERDVTRLEAQPIHVPQTSYRVVDKAHDDDAARGEAHFGSLNGKPLDLDALARDAKKHAGTPDRIR